MHQAIPLPNSSCCIVAVVVVVVELVSGIHVHAKDGWRPDERVNTVGNGWILLASAASGFCN